MMPSFRRQSMASSNKTERYLMGYWMTMRLAGHVHRFLLITVSVMFLTIL